jgi:ribonuclease HI/pterin-4a-carbinolamine dehydratase
MWQEKDNQLYRQFEFKNFREAFKFMAAVADLAEAAQHHPRWENEWNKVQIWLSTHEAGNVITNKDKHLADEIDKAFNRLEQTHFVEQKTTLKPEEVGVDKEVKLFSDGGSRGNPGPSAAGYVLIDMQDEVIVKNGLYLGITTNNQAEYQGLKLGLDEAKKRGVRVVNVYLDSLLVVNQMKGIFKIKNRDLWPIHQAITEELKDFQHVTFTHVPREFNQLADRMVNDILNDTDRGEVS